MTIDPGFTYEDCCKLVDAHNAAVKSVLVEILNDGLTPEREAHHAELTKRAKYLYELAKIVAEEKYQQLLSKQEQTFPALAGFGLGSTDTAKKPFDA